MMIKVIKVEEVENPTTGRMNQCYKSAVLCYGEISGMVEHYLDNGLGNRIEGTKITFKNGEKWIIKNSIKDIIKVSLT